MKRKVFLGIVLALLWISTFAGGMTAVVRGHAPGISLSAFATRAPTIDGTIDLDEWQNASVVSTTKGMFEITLFVMNDMVNLYLAVRVSDILKGTPEDDLWFVFDNDHDNIAEPGDDTLYVSIDGFEDKYYIPGWISDQSYGGTIDGSGATAVMNGYREYELMHPLNSTDLLDFSLRTGDTVGFYLEFTDFDLDIGRGHCIDWPAYILNGVYTGPLGDITIAASLQVNIDIFPETLNTHSLTGKWITAYIELPEGHDVNDIDLSSVKMNGEVPAESHPTKIGDYDKDGIPDLMVKFYRAKVVRSILRTGDDEVIVRGMVLGKSFEGSETIRVIT